MSNLEYKIEETLAKYKSSYSFELMVGKVTKEQIRKSIEHTLLKPYASPADVEKLCREAVEYGFLGVCVNPSLVPVAVSTLRGTDVRVVTVIGFPLGCNTQMIKAKEAQEAREAGVSEIDMVVHIGMLKANEWLYVYEDIRAVVEAARDLAVKVILETCYLSDEEKIAACVIAKEAGASFVKTSTGFGTKGATVEDVHLMKWAVPDLGVKASGGIKNFSQATEMIRAGANRIGTSSGVSIISEGV